MNDNIKRIDPRRPFIVTSAGLKRITLGEIGSGALLDFVATHHDAAKPRRTAKASRRAVLVAAHTDRGALDDHGRQALAAAALLADDETEVVLIAFGAFSDDAASLGADRYIELPGFDRRHFAPDEELRALAACVAAFTPVHVFMPDNATGDGDLGRRYAARAGASIATHVVELDLQHVAAYAHAGRAVALRALPDVILLAPNAVDAKLPYVGAGARVNSEDVVPATMPSAYVDLGIEEMDAAQVALEEADFIISAGNGVTDVPAFEALASTLGAAIGASRVAVDDGKFSRDKQIGATGKTVEASVYIAFGISGAVQHLQGIKDCRHVIAVNLDASAPIAKRADLTIVADTQETIKALTDAASAARASRTNGSPILQTATLAEGAYA
ncbi:MULTISPECIES: electron transfer flavoprotein subunit alpha/FixB family protein [unclassified Caballeronia]|jgi:electron transfer flavoprotein alpha subunit|uniref:electron transfer flavoprotein subunit alpha/FixB family protein n=1 Tax=unclassified Caballeronia TaxID=2646786 RepID=UPI002028589D|nr:MULTISPECIES: electron transfer flavoprotein subunit alpha/FixB family protein [unclassified Caballeronia]MDR5776121.1 electron transfer flavoprotein subunit alpha/FixB family protein [Caballeronia sp. LZ002]MDR5851561.1 electron transfer flavoprotein subunit alpha/FixB family protein [Caballeronia sp. LZ003]